ncbi:MAG: hypothetical protein HY730_09730 [Candidatus Tectomicrobia bacterium]|uniref:Nucleotide modification associated domain-containing protein n=1 Tax=Tectimicrobiota bacterium TaxID=2528274 RepID=A0A933GP09_UNCTE|nr:hypothetical protein [Candidatus Tectomicrobia bacterium]
MKVILSRKGFDSGNSKMPSPIMPDGTPLSLPIPRRRGYCRSYDDLLFRGQTLGDIIRDLANGGLPFDDNAHADPDLEKERLPRKVGWRPIFGQTGGNQSHLENEGVGIGDIFLFFGWFRHTAITPVGRLAYVGPRDGVHALFGWLQIGEIHRANVNLAGALPSWMHDHPHVASPDSFDSNNTIYVARERLKLGVDELSIPGGGTFPRFTPALRLTGPEGPRTCWKLPKWFRPGAEKPPMSYHGDRSRWSTIGDHTILRTVARGQEFVLDTRHYPEAHPWIASLFEAGEGDPE